MENDLPSVFSNSSMATTTVTLTHHEVILKGYFWTGRQCLSSQKILVALTDSHLCVCQDVSHSCPDDMLTEVKYRSELNFDLKFELMRDASTKKDGCTILGAPYSIRLQRHGHKGANLFASQQALTKWKCHLEAKINRIGFHSMFKPIRKIGKGNFASVYLAERYEDGKMVAVKAFSKLATFSQPKGKQSLINEINLMRKVKQENLMELCAVFQSQNSIYMTMELLEGGQLFQKIQSKHQFTKQETKQIMMGLLKGLETMHSKRIMHRDLKPENIMLRHRDSCEVVIVDFGLATWADEQNYLFVRCGTPGYVAPEIINITDMKTKSQPACDVFSAGLIFHILLMGKSVFPGRTYKDVLKQNRACDFDLDSRDYGCIQPQAHDLLKLMLQKSPSRRITALEALNHPYFEDNSMDIQYPLVGLNQPLPVLLDLNKVTDGKRDQIRLLNKVSISLKPQQGMNVQDFQGGNNVVINKQNA